MNMISNVFKMAASSTGNVLSYEGCNFFRQRFILATLSGKSVKIKKIRAKSNDPGLKGEFFHGETWFLSK